MFLFFDTETADLPRRWNAPASDTANWPRMVQLAWILCESKKDAKGPEVHLIKPDRFRIAPGAFEQHGISTEFAEKNGVPIQPVLDAFLEAVRSAKVLVGHNVSFDVSVVGAEFIRAGMDDPLEKKKTHCTMKRSTDYCRLPGKRGYKWPTLAELHSILFDETFDDAHDAANDCLACMKCYFRLRELGVIK